MRLEFERGACISYSQKFHGKCGFPNLTNGRTSQFMFRKYLLGYRKWKNREIKFGNEKSN